MYRVKPRTLFENTQTVIRDIVSSCDFTIIRGEIARKNGYVFFPIAFGQHRQFDPFSSKLRPFWCDTLLNHRSWDLTGFTRGRGRNGYDRDTR